MKTSDLIPGGTSVVNVNRGQAFDVMVDRSTPWGNPYTHVQGATRAQHVVGSRSESIAWYRRWIPNQLHLLVRLHTLRGRRLGCHCWPEDCHASILADLADGPLGDPSMRAAEHLLYLAEHVARSQGPVNVACIGSRAASVSDLSFWWAVGKYIVRCGAHLRTGNAEGVDQAAAWGGNQIEPSRVSLVLPWRSYEAHRIHPGNVVEVGEAPPENLDLVRLLHPNPDALQPGDWKLHARNVDIVRTCWFVLAQPRTGPRAGGTGMGMAVARFMGIPVLDVNPPEVRDLITRIVSR